MTVKQITVHLFHLLDKHGASVGWVRRHFDGPKSWWVAHEMATATETGHTDFDDAMEALRACAADPHPAPAEEGASRFSLIEVD